MITVIPDLYSQTGEVRQKFDFNVVELKDKSDAPLFSPAIYDGNRRKLSACKQVTGCCIDFDNRESNTSYEDVIAEIEDLEHYAYSTFSNSAARPKFRLFIPFKNPIVPVAFERVFFDLVDLLGSPAGIDFSSKEISRFYFLPCCNADNKKIAFVNHNKGDFYVPDVRNISEAHAVSVPKKTSAGRNDYLKSVCSKLILSGYDFSDVVDELLTADRTFHTAPLFEDPHEFKDSYKLPRLSAIKFAHNICVSLNDKAESCVQVPNRHRKQVRKINFDKPKEFDRLIDADFVYRVPGLVGLIAVDIFEKARFPQAPLALQAALNIVGALKAHQMRYWSGLRTNLFTFGVCDTGCGKDTPLKYIRSLCSALELYEMDCGAPRSFAGFFTGLKKSHCHPLICWDEIGRDFKLMLSSKNDFQAKMSTELLKLFSCADDYYQPGLIAEQKNKEPDPIFLQPVVNIFGVTVPRHLFEAFNSGHVTDGLMPRFLYFVCPEKVRRNHSAGRIKVSDAVLEKCGPLVEQTLIYKSKTQEIPNLTQTNVSYFGTQESPIDVAISDDAIELSVEIQDQVDSWRGNRDFIAASIFTRIEEHILKVALILCDDFKITKNDLQIAREIVMTCQLRYIVDIKKFSSDNDFESHLKRAKLFIREKEFVTNRDLMRHMRLRAYELKAVVQWLRLAEYIDIVEDDSKKTVYKIKE